MEHKTQLYSKIELKLKVQTSVARCETQKSGIPTSKSWKFPERVFRVNFDCLKCIVLNQIITDVILYLHKIYLNEITENRHQNIVN